nr:hypothetical protein [Tanacetum cinerariifolium]
KLLEDLHIINKELKCNHPTFSDDNEDHSVQYKENLENASNSKQEKERPPKDSDIRLLIREECCIEVCEEQKQNMENTILELVEICRQKELICMHDNVDDVIESTLNSKLLSINSQRLNKEKKEVKNVVEQPAERRTRIVESLQNFRVIHKSSTSLKNTSQISPVQAFAPILSTKEPEYSPSMGYEHLSTTPETELDEVTESSTKNLLPISSECKVTLEDESKCDMPIQDQSSSVFTTFSNPPFKDNDDLTSSSDESLSEEVVPIEESKVYSNPLFDHDEINSDELESHVESNFDALIGSSQKINYLEEFSSELAHINPKITDLILTLRKKSVLLRICYMIIREEIDIVTNTDELLPPGFENNDLERKVDVVEELRVDKSISNFENELSANEESDFDNPSVPRPPSEPLDAKFDFELDVG